MWEEKKKEMLLILPVKGWSHPKKDCKEKHNEHHMYYLLFWFLKCSTAQAPPATCIKMCQSTY